MKKFADFKLSDGQYKRISIWDIYNDYKKYKYELNYLYDIKQFYKDFYKGNLFSTHFKSENKKRLSLCIFDNYKDSFFRYCKNDSFQYCSQESAPHELFKDIISAYDKLTLKNNNQIIVLYISESDIEHEFIANGNRYYADIYFKFYKSEPEEYLYKWNGELCFEIKYSHAVDSKKRVDCYREGIAVFEHTISKAYADRIKDIDSKHTEELVVDEITRMLETAIYGKLISDPEIVGYTKIRNLQNKINELEYRYNAQQQSIKNLEEMRDFFKKEKNTLLTFKKSVESKKLLKFLLKLYRIK